MRVRASVRVRAYAVPTPLTSAVVGGGAATSMTFLASWEALLATVLATDVHMCLAFLRCRCRVVLCWCAPPHNNHRLLLLARKRGIMQAG
jgi:hypothetical protein